MAEAKLLIAMANWTFIGVTAWPSRCKVCSRVIWSSCHWSGLGIPSFIAIKTRVEISRKRLIWSTKHILLGPFDLYLRAFWRFWTPKAVETIDSSSFNSTLFKYLQTSSDLEFSHFWICAILWISKIWPTWNIPRIDTSHCTFQLSLFLMDLFVSTHHHLSPVLSYVKFPFLQDCDAGSHGTRGARRIQ